MAHTNWIIDADRFDLSKNYNLCLITPIMADFISSENVKEYFIIATKGIGKTLLLKLKRDSLNGIIIIPESGIDKFANSNTLSHDSIELFTDLSNMEIIWSISIILASLRRIKYVFVDITLNSYLVKLYNNSLVETVNDYFCNLIHIDRANYFKSKNDLESVLIPLYKKMVNSTIAIFIDNIDEYFNKHLEKEYKESITGQLEPELWYTSQMGLVKSYFHLHKLNHHVRLYASIRKEAFMKYEGIEINYQQIRESVIMLDYNYKELEKIFINNIQNEVNEKIVDSSLLKKEPIKAFLGYNTIYHKHVKKRENVFQYIVRHTLYRPRDLMQIGLGISRSPVSERNQKMLRDLVNDESMRIINTYLSEVKPHINYIDFDRLFSYIDNNALSKEDMTDICRIYNHKEECNDNKCKDCKETHVFCTLYKIGLLGTIYSDGEEKRRVQKFLMPGEKTFEGNGILPVSELYLIHPILNSSIRFKNVSFINKRNKDNIIGNGLYWYIGNDKKVMSYMAKISLDNEVKDESLSELINKILNEIDIYKIRIEYDYNKCITIQSEDIERLYNVVRQIINASNKHKLVHKAIIDSGYINRDIKDKNESIVYKSSSFLLNYVIKNQIWFTESVKYKIVQKKLNIEYEDLYMLSSEILNQFRLNNTFSIPIDKNKIKKMKIFKIL